MTKDGGDVTPGRRKLPSTSQQPPLGPSRGRIYRTIAGEGSGTAWVTRDIAALDFLLGIPMEAEPSIVQAGWMKQQGHQSLDSEDIVPQVTASGRWWEKLVVKGQAASNHYMRGMMRGSKASSHNEELEQPDLHEKREHNGIVPTTHLAAPGRRLDGDDAIRVQIPLSGVLETKTRQRTIARQAAIREWEVRVAHGLDDGGKPLLDGRAYFSVAGGYPAEVFSVIKYEPKKEEALRRRQKLEELGGGGSHFIIPERDWRGTSYRALLPRAEKKNKSFNRVLRRRRHENNDHSGSDSDSDLSSSSDESDAYVPGFLDDPEMVQGRHRHVMIGDRVTGCLVSSTIQFVKPEDLKADLNKQFRERFDGWEPPKSQWKYIGAKVIDGVYTLLDPTVDPTEDHDERKEDERSRKGSMSSMSSISSTVEAKDTLRMPPSLTLSKIRAVKQQALNAAVEAKLEVSTVALACVYFERLCLDTRVDKTNRRLSFAACLLLAAKINESTLSMIQKRGDEDEDKKARLQSLIRPTKKSRSMFASLLQFFTHDWNLSLKNVFAAEWGVFVALGFSLHTTPSQVEFHYRRLMKMLEWSSLGYLGPEMQQQWIESLDEEDLQRAEHEKRKQLRRDHKERKLLKLQRELRLKVDNSTERQDNDADTLNEKLSEDADEDAFEGIATTDGISSSKAQVPGRKTGARRLLHRLTLKRPPSMDKLSEADRLPVSEHMTPVKHKEIVRSPSLPVISGRRHTKAAHVALDVNEVEESDGDSLVAVSDGGILF